MLTDPPVPSDFCVCVPILCLLTFDLSSLSTVCSVLFIRFLFVKVLYVTFNQEKAEDPSLVAFSIQLREVSFPAQVIPAQEETI